MSSNEPAHVLVVGGANIDISAVAGSRVVAGQSSPGKIVRTFGGVGRNIAETLARLGVKTRLATLTANDETGDALLRHLLQVGVDTRPCVRADGSDATADGTPQFVSVVSTTGEVVAQVSDMTLLDNCPVGQFAHLPELIAESDFVVVDANLPAPVLGLIFEAQGDAIFLADAVSPTKCLRLKPWLSSLSLIKANEAEAAALTNMAINTKGYGATLLQRLIDAVDGSVLLSHGANGATLSDGEHRVSEPCRSDPIKSINTNGTGDALLAGVIAARLHGYDLAMQLNFGQRLAALASQVHDAVNPTIDSHLIADLSRRSIDQ